MQLTIETYFPTGASSVPLTTFGALTMNAGEVKVNGVANTTSGDSFDFEVDTNSLVKIEINKEGYYSYEMVVRTFNASVLYPINLAPIILSELDLNKDVPYPGALFHHGTCTKSVWFYDWDSYPGDSEWYLNGELVHVGRSGTLEFNNEGGIQLIQRKRSYYPTEAGEQELVRWDRYKGNYYDAAAENGYIQNSAPGVGVDQPASFYLDQFVNDTFYIVNPLPNVETLVSEPIDGECYARGETVTVQAVFTGTSGATVNVKWRVTSNAGIVEEDLGQTENPTPLVIDLTELGEYTIELIHETLCGTKTYTNVVECCNFYEVTTDNCGKFTVKNHSTTRNVEVSVTNYANQAIEDIEPETLLPGEAITYSLETGQFVFTFSYQGKEEYQVVSNFCALEDCMAAYIENVLCEETGCKCEVDVSAETAALRNLALTNTYFMYLNQFHSLANYYTALEDSLLNDLFNAEITLVKIKKMCERLGCKGTDCGCKKTKTSKCGCK